MTAPLTSPLGGDDLAKALRDAYGQGYAVGPGFGARLMEQVKIAHRDAWIAQYIARLPAAEPITTASNPRVGDDVGRELEDLAAAIDAADHGYSIALISLTEAGSVYALDLCDGSDPVKFADRDDAREHAERHRSLARAKAALTFLSARNEEAR